ncbi:DUF47 family protein [Mesorhizobium sp. NBSH29]|uniref:DUF47 domain-containing protein n=1 Tax=Mesorhizobium sp. NBSH29 TaxID=2654249 RepID=UPI0018969949|nr:DUF47 domain-containing protein [Mesorhizobium sp. NBSH29]QPC88605.1 DUF47 family protein [Mesorhizobium sp. NBSH29]
MLGWFRALMPREDRFFDLFDEHAQIVLRASKALQKLLAGEGDAATLCQQIMDLENEADAVTAKVMTAVHKSFITPFDRGDIKDLIQSLDDAVDMMRKTVKTIILFEQKDFDPRMQEMGKLIVEAAELTAKAIPLLNKVGTHAEKLQQIAGEVKRVESRSDALHDEGLKDLFQRHRDSDPMAYMIGSEIYGELEKAVDRFEDVANEISGIVVENV